MEMSQRGRRRPKRNRGPESERARHKREKEKKRRGNGANERRWKWHEETESVGRGSADQPMIHTLAKLKVGWLQPAGGGISTVFTMSPSILHLSLSLDSTLSNSPSTLSILPSISS